MAKQKGPLFITGTYNGICYYKLNGKYYARKKSTLSRKRVKRTPAFRLTMVYAGLMAQASKLAASVYRTIPFDRRKHALYRALTGQALGLLKKGTDTSVILAHLKECCISAKVLASASTAPAGIVPASTTAEVLAPAVTTPEKAASPAFKPAALGSNKHPRAVPALQMKYNRIFLHPGRRVPVVTGPVPYPGKHSRRRRYVLLE